MKPLSTLRRERKYARLATYLGYQQGVIGAPGFTLWTLRQDIPGHPAGSTVSGETLERYLAGQKFTVSMEVLK